ncbi:hypothetical protein Ancab_009223 [Ancistrocladus abbreviatus]
MNALTNNTDARPILIWLLLLLTAQLINLSSCNKNSGTICSDKEKQALLNFKEGLNDPVNRLSSWSPLKEYDCCKWLGVICNSTTGHVIKLQLQNPKSSLPLRVKISHSLLELKHLSHLDLSGNDFQFARIPNFLGAMESLEYLNLSHAMLGEFIPHDLGKISTLRYLDLSFNQLTGQIPDHLGKLTHLRELFLSHNHLSGSIPSSLGTLSSLQILSLSTNRLIGPLPNLSSLSDLEILTIDNNYLSGNISVIHFTNCSKLKNFDASSNKFLSFSFSQNSVPPFQLETINLSWCQVGPRFPTWLKTQTNVQVLALSNSGIEDVVPHWFWNWVSHVPNVNISHNQIYGNLTSVLLNSTVIRIDYNRFEGQLPYLSPNVEWLTVGHNSLTASLSSFICHKNNWGNKLKRFGAGNSTLSGELSDCWKHWQSLVAIDLGFNHLAGKIHSSFGSLSALQSLHLHHNKLFGHIPASLRDLNSLRFINLRENKLSGNLPSWIGEWINVSILALGGNRFTGTIPSQACHLSSLAVLDLSRNRLSGAIPRCLNNLTLMFTTNIPLNSSLVVYIPIPEQPVQNFCEYLTIVTKGIVYTYDKTLTFLRMIDLSQNMLSGSIPDDICELKGIQYLNLSHNQLTGNVPEAIGNMERLEALDLSRNHISGQIPRSMSALPYIANLDLSYNNLWGEIPTSTQLQSLDNSSFIGNAGLCGPPLTLICTKQENFPPAPVDNENGHNKFEILWFYAGMGPGFAAGFLGVCCFLLLRKKRRHAGLM